MKALVAEDILHNHDTNIQVAVASCFSELTRISAPETTYPDDLMKVIFRSFINSFNQLSGEKNKNYSRALRILETMAKVKSALMLMIMDSNGMIIEMFQLFLCNIRFKLKSGLFRNMETIMTVVIEESDNISIELLRPLLDSVKKDNKDASPLSWKLGRKVLENCANKLRHCAKTMNVDLGDYAEIVALTCNGPYNRDTVVRGDKFSGEVVSDEYRESKDLPLLSDLGCTSMTNASSRKLLESFDEVNLQKMKGALSKPQHSKDLKKEKKLRRPPIDYKEELVGSRIKVWWPMDGKFYPGKVKAYDSDTKKHVVLYEDNEVEILDLRKETWKLMVYEHHTQVSKRKEANRKLSEKQSTVASSKRSKIESRPVMAPEQNLAANLFPRLCK